MRYNTTPTNGLIEEAAELYVLLLAGLFIPVGALVFYPGEPRKAVVRFDVAHCQGVENAAMFWHEGITTPLLAAHVAAHELEQVSDARHQRQALPNSPYSVEARREVKRLRAIIAESDMAIRRELRGLGDLLTRNI